MLSLGSPQPGWERIQTEREQAETHRRSPLCTLKEYCIHLSRSFDYVSIILVLIGSMFGVSMEHVVNTFQAEREHD